MIGHQVRVLMEGSTAYVVEGTLLELNSSGIMLRREHTLPEGRGTVFIPMHRIREIVDQGERRTL